MMVAGVSVAFMGIALYFLSKDYRAAGLDQSVESLR